MPAVNMGTTLRNPDFAMFAQACGGRGFRVTRPEALRATVAEALAAAGPVVVDVAVDPDEIPLMPHFDAAKALRFGIGKMREILT